MEEKIIIKSRMNQIVKNYLKFAPIVCFAMTVLFSILLSVPTEVERYSSWYGTYMTETVIGWKYLFNLDYYGYNELFLWFILDCLSLLVGIVAGIIYFANRNCELQITENSVKGKTLFGREVVLPLDMVSAYSTSKLLSVVAVATASGITRFSLVENYKEIGDVLSRLISQRQRNTQVDNTESYSKSDSMDDLIKLKSLLDAGIITQEEFDAKKKQLLGL